MHFYEKHIYIQVLGTDIYIFMFQSLKDVIRNKEKRKSGNVWSNCIIIQNKQKQKPLKLLYVHHMCSI